jgi:hypothetical protein
MWVLVDAPDLKVGDTVREKGTLGVLGEVLTIRDTHAFIKTVSGRYTTQPLQMLARVVEPRALAVGDAVKFAPVIGRSRDDHDWRGEIIGIHPVSGKVWVRDHNGPGTRDASSLVRA